MFLQEVFEGDNNQALKEAQCEQYKTNRMFIFLVARAQLELAIKILGADLYLVKKIAAIEKFDFTVLEDALSIIAGAYRHTYFTEGQMELWPEKSTLTNNWINWYKKEIRTLCESPLFVRFVVEAVALSGSLKGKKAQYQLGCFLMKRYQVKSLDFTNKFLQKYTDVNDLAVTNAFEIFDNEGNEIHQLSDLPSQLLEKLHKHLIYLAEDMAQDFSGEAKSEIKILQALIAGYNIHHHYGHKLSEALEKFRGDLLMGSGCIPNYSSMVVNLRRKISAILEKRENRPY